MNNYTQSPVKYPSIQDWELDQFDNIEKKAIPIRKLQRELGHMKKALGRYIKHFNQSRFND